MELDELFEHRIGFPFPGTESGGQAAPDQSGAEPSSSAEESQRAEASKTRRERDPIPAGGGVYLLTDEADRMVVLASAGNLRRGLRVRLSGVADVAGGADAAGVSVSCRRANLSEVVRWVRWRTADSPFEISWRYWQAARALLPGTYRKQLGFGPAWFVHVDAQAAVPRLVVGKVLGGEPGVDLGPFFTQSDAGRFVQVLQDGFDLCRYEHILAQAPRGTACAYFEMGKCPGPCDGSVPMERYRAMVAEAVAFAAGGREGLYQHIEQSMREAAERREYEAAGRLKQRLERLREIEHKSLRLAGPIERFSYLVVQRGGGRTRVRPFFVRAGRIAMGERVRLKQLAEAVPGWVETLKADEQTRLTADSDRQTVSEQIWLVNHYLGKKDPPGLFVRADELPDAAELVRMIEERFAKPIQPTEEAELGGSSQEFVDGRQE